MTKDLEILFPFPKGPDPSCEKCKGEGYVTYYVPVGEDDVDKDFYECDCENRRHQEHQHWLEAMDIDTDTILLLGDDECLKSE